VRLTGWVLLLIGGLLCATIAWAALGFLLMGVGLISLQVAERRRRPAGDLVPAGAAGFVPPRLSAGLQPPTLDPIAGQEGSPQRQPRRVAWPDRSGGAAYDQQAWRRLVDSDPDIARLAKVLADYGPQYVDELAASYLAAPDKKRLGAIVDGIITRARNGQPAPPPAPVAGSQPPPLPPLPEPKPVAARAAEPATSPGNPAGALETSLLGAVEEASARIAAERAGLFKPRKATDSRPSGQQEPAVGRPPRDSELQPKPADPPGDLEASLIAAVSEAAARRTDTFKPTASPPPAKPEPRATAADAPKLPPPPPLAKAPPAKPAPAKQPPADDLDESLLAALAEISGQKIGDEPKIEPKQGAASEDPPGSPIDDGLSEMVKKFAPDSNFLRKQ